MKRTLCLALAAALLFAGPALAIDPQEAAKQAYDAGDYATAAKELTTLAARGDAAAQYNLAIMYTQGKGVTKDYAAAAALFGKAARAGNALAQYDLAMMYRDGVGLDKDLSRAWLWFDLAALAQTGSDAAQSAKARDDVAKKMTPEELQDAHDMDESCRQTEIRYCD